MNNFQKIADFFHMTDEVWARHANPWSVWTRYLSLPLLILAIWSRVWLGWAYIVPVVVVLIWIWLNPRIFPKPQSTNNWTSKGVLGERVWLNQEKVPIPEHHKPIIFFTNTVNFVGFLICLWGLVTLKIYPTLLGLSWVILGKTWFLDRMVWLYDEMKDTQAEYSSWLY